jgi:hypothetical protein
MGAFSCCAPQVDAGIKGITPGAETQHFLARKAFAARLVGCLALGGLAVAAELADRACGALLGAPVGCMNFLLLAGLLTSMERQARSPAWHVAQECLLAAPMRGPAQSWGSSTLPFSARHARPVPHA